MRRRRGTAVLAAAAIAVAGVGCGSEDFPNDPRPPKPIQLTAKIGQKRVVVSPTKIDGAPIGAGIANITISNQNDEDLSLTLSGPIDVSSDPVIAGGVLDFDVNLEQGDYVAGTSDDSLSEDEFTIGPERPSAQNDLLLP